jgi:hypothetical protein
VVPVVLLLIVARVGRQLLARLALYLNASLLVD